MIMGRSEVEECEGPFAISETVKNSLRRTLFVDGFDLSTARSGGCIVVVGRKLMAKARGLRENIDHAFDILAERAGLAAICGGIYEDNRDSLRVYTIFSGLNSPAAKLNELTSEHYFRPDLIDTEGLPLRQRREDIGPLAEHFLANHADSYGKPQKILSLEARELLLNYSWPGNVGELAKAIQRACELTSGGVIQPDALPFQIVFADSEAYPKCLLPVLNHTKRGIITRALELTRERGATARLIGIDRDHLDVLIKELDVQAAERGASG